jgi:hypothetical protein
MPSSRVKALQAKLQEEGKLQEQEQVQVQEQECKLTDSLRQLTIMLG